MLCAMHLTYLYLTIVTQPLYWYNYGIFAFAKYYNIKLRFELLFSNGTVITGSILRWGAVKQPIYLSIVLTLFYNQQR